MEQKDRNQKEEKKGIPGMDLILASGSPRRRELLSGIGLTYEVIPSTVEEKVTVSRPEEVVLSLAEQKAAEVCERLRTSGREGFLVLGADTIVALGEEIMGKPGDEAEACRMLSSLQGGRHQVYTGVAFCIPETDGIRTYSFYEKTEVEMYPMTAEEIRDYVAGGEPMDKAGAYAIQGGCAAYIKGIHGDYTNVVGLPVGRVWQEMKKRSWENTDPSDSPV